MVPEDTTWGQFVVPGVVGTVPGRNELKEKFPNNACLSQIAAAAPGAVMNDAGRVRN